MAEGTPPANPTTRRHPGESRDPAEAPGLDSGFHRSDEKGESALDAASLQKLMAWLSPSFPVGAYTYSHGLEWAIEDGSVTNAALLESWLTAILLHGAGRTDAILFCHAWRGDAQALRAVAEVGSAFQPSKERHLEAVAQGRAFLSAVSAAWPNPRLGAAMAALGDAPVPYPVAVGAAAAAHDMPLMPALIATLTAFAANIISAGVRAIPIGQSDGQRLVAALGPVVATVARDAEHTSLDDLGGVALRADIASMKHETQYTRLFRS